MDAAASERWAAIPLRGRDGSIAGYTLIDAADSARLGEIPWRLSSHGYAVRSEVVDGAKKTCYLHRLIADTPPGAVTDHINGDRLDNRRMNLRIVSIAQNNANSRNRTRRSGYRGVYAHKPTGRWVAQISVHGRLTHLGLFDDPADAARAYDRAALAQWGPWARTNGIA